MKNVILLFFLVQVASGLQICGNFCGPSWCNAMAIPESLCDGKAEPDKDVFLVDSCCRDHDMCCGHGNRSTCNDRIIECITKDRPGLLASEYLCEGVTIAYFFEALGFMARMLAGETMCCSEPCALPGVPITYN